MSDVWWFEKRFDAVQFDLISQMWKNYIHDKKDGLLMKFGFRVVKVQSIHGIYSNRSTNHAPKRPATFLKFMSSEFLNFQISPCFPPSFPKKSLFFTLCKIMDCLGPDSLLLSFLDGTLGVPLAMLKLLHMALANSKSQNKIDFTLFSPNWKEVAFKFAPPYSNLCRRLLFL